MRQADWITTSVLVDQTAQLAEAHSQSRRGIHETTPLWFCCDRRNGARCYHCWKRDLRRGLSAISPRGSVWYMPPGLLARPRKAGVLDTTRRAGTVWRVPAELSPWATTGRVLGGLRRLGHARLAAGSSPSRRYTDFDEDRLISEALSIQRLDCVDISLRRLEPSTRVACHPKPVRA